MKTNTCKIEILNESNKWEWKDISYEYVHIPGLFSYREAVEFVRLLKSELGKFRLPTFQEGCMIMKVYTKKYDSSQPHAIRTSDFKEFGEDGNWVYQADKYHYPLIFINPDENYYEKEIAEVTVDSAIRLGLILVKQC